MGKINFRTDKMAVLSGIFDAEIKATKYITRHPEKKEKFKKWRTIGASRTTTEFFKDRVIPICKKVGVLGPDSKLIDKKGNNFFEELLTLDSSHGKDEYLKQAMTRLKYTYNIFDNPEVESELETFLSDFWDLQDDPRMQNVFNEAESYCKSLRHDWHENEADILSSMRAVVGSKEFGLGEKKVDVFVLYPNFSTTRTVPSSDKLKLYLGSIKDKDTKQRVLSNLTFQIVDKSILPDSPLLSEKQKKGAMAFKTFLAYKEPYKRLTGGTYTSISVPNEDSETMAQVYPYYLAYKSRKAENPVANINQDLVNDVEWLVQNPNSRVRYRDYSFRKFDPLKISMFYRERKGMKPEEVITTDFSKQSRLYKPKYLSKQPEANLKASRVVGE